VNARILIADDDATIRLLLRRLLEKQGDWEVCGEATNGIEAIEKAAQLAPDILIMDQAMPTMSGMQAARAIAARYPQLPMLSFSVEQVSVDFAEAVRQVGFKGAVTKISGSEIVAGVEALLRNQMFFKAEITVRAHPENTSDNVSWARPVQS
jgi:DNA-binding NarL/FixJ family response regulator